MDVLDQVIAHLNGIQNQDLLNYLDDLPSQTGRHSWFHTSSDSGQDHYECTKCGHRASLLSDGYYKIETMHFDECKGKKKDFGSIL